MSNHTPAPWTLQQLETRHNGYDWPTFTIRSYPQNCCLAVIGDVDRYHADQNEANANLIATAPELLEALRNLLALETRYTSVRLKEFDAARAAITKAEGENIR